MGDRPTNSLIKNNGEFIIFRTGTLQLSTAAPASTTETAEVYTAVKLCNNKPIAYSFYIDKITNEIIMNGIEDPNVLANSEKLVAAMTETKIDSLTKAIWPKSKQAATAAGGGRNASKKTNRKFKEGDTITLPNGKTRVICKRNGVLKVRVNNKYEPVSKYFP